MVNRVQPFGGIFGALLVARTFLQTWATTPLDKDPSCVSMEIDSAPSSSEDSQCSAVLLSIQLQASTESCASDLTTSLTLEEEPRDVTTYGEYESTAQVSGKQIEWTAPQLGSASPLGLEFVMEFCDYCDLYSDAEIRPISDLRYRDANGNEPNERKDALTLTLPCDGLEGDPVESIIASPSPTPAFVEDTPAPTTGTSPSPTEVTPAPTEMTSAPVVMTSAPVAITHAPVVLTVAPVGTTAGPVDMTPLPTDLTTPPSEIAPMPAERTMAPSEATPAPYRKETPAPSGVTPEPTASVVDSPTLDPAEPQPTASPAPVVRATATDSYQLPTPSFSPSGTSWDDRQENGTMLVTPAPLPLGGNTSAGDEETIMPSSSSSTAQFFTSSPTLKPPDPITAEPTPLPSPTLMMRPTDVPTAVPTNIATALPTDVLITAPTASPTGAITTFPTGAPTTSTVITGAPTTSPTGSPTHSHTLAPTFSPTRLPSVSPTSLPTASPTSSPTVSPTSSPTVSPTSSPTVSPTSSPTVSPTSSPTVSPTSSPTTSPTTVPTGSPTSSPTSSPTDSSSATRSPVAIRPTSSPMGLLPGGQPYGTGLTVQIQSIFDARRRLSNTRGDAGESEVQKEHNVFSIEAAYDGDVESYNREMRAVCAAAFEVDEADVLYVYSDFGDGWSSPVDDGGRRQLQREGNGRRLYASGITPGPYAPITTCEVDLGAEGETRAMIAAAAVDRFFHSENIALLVDQNSYDPVDVLVRLISFWQDGCRGTCPATEDSSTSVSAVVQAADEEDGESPDAEDDYLFWFLVILSCLVVLLVCTWTFSCVWFWRGRLRAQRDRDTKTVKPKLCNSIPTNDGANGNGSAPPTAPETGPRKSHTPGPISANSAKAGSGFAEPPSPGEAHWRWKFGLAPSRESSQKSAPISPKFTRHDHKEGAESSSSSDIHRMLGDRFFGPSGDGYSPSVGSYGHSKRNMKRGEYKHAESSSNDSKDLSPWRDVLDPETRPRNDPVEPCSSFGASATKASKQALSPRQELDRLRETLTRKENASMNSGNTQAESHRPVLNSPTASPSSRMSSGRGFSDSRSPTSNMGLHLAGRHHLSTSTATPILEIDLEEDEQEEEVEEGKSPMNKDSGPWRDAAASGFASPRSGAVSPARSPRAAPLAHRAVVLSPRSRTCSPRSGPLSPHAGPLSPRAGPLSPRAGPLSPRAGTMSPRKGTPPSRRSASPPRRTAPFPSSAAAGASDDTPSVPLVRRGGVIATATSSPPSTPGSKARQNGRNTYGRAPEEVSKGEEDWERSPSCISDAMSRVTSSERDDESRGAGSRLSSPAARTGIATGAVLSGKGDIDYGTGEQRSRSRSPAPMPPLPRSGAESRSPRRSLLGSPSLGSSPHGSSRQGYSPRALSPRGVGNRANGQEKATAAANERKIMNPFSSPLHRSPSNRSTGSMNPFSPSSTSLKGPSLRRSETPSDPVPPPPSALPTHSEQKNPFLASPTRSASSCGTANPFPPSRNARLVAEKVPSVLPGSPTRSARSERITNPFPLSPTRSPRSKQEGPSSPQRTMSSLPSMSISDDLDSETQSERSSNPVMWRGISFASSSFTSQASSVESCCATFDEDVTRKDGEYRGLEQRDGGGEEEGGEGEGGGGGMQRIVGGEKCEEQEETNHRMGEHGQQQPNQESAVIETRSARPPVHPGSLRRGGSEDVEAEDSETDLSSPSLSLESALALSRSRTITPDLTPVAEGSCEGFFGDSDEESDMSTEVSSRSSMGRASGGSGIMRRISKRWRDPSSLMAAVVHKAGQIASIPPPSSGSSGHGARSLPPVNDAPREPSVTTPTIAADSLGTQAVSTPCRVKGEIVPPLADVRSVKEMRGSAEVSNGSGRAMATNTNMVQNTGGTRAAATDEGGHMEETIQIDRSSSAEKSSGLASTKSEAGPDTNTSKVQVDTADEAGDESDTDVHMEDATGSVQTEKERGEQVPPPAASIEISPLGKVVSYKDMETKLRSPLGTTKDPFLDVSRTPQRRRSGEEGSFSLMGALSTFLRRSPGRKSDIPRVATSAPRVAVFSGRSDSNRTDVVTPETRSIPVSPAPVAIDIPPSAIVGESGTFVVPREDECEVLPVSGDSASGAPSAKADVLLDLRRNMDREKNMRCEKRLKFMEQEAGAKDKEGRNKQGVETTDRGDEPVGGGAVPPHSLSPLVVPSDDDSIGTLAGPGDSCFSRATMTLQSPNPSLPPLPEETSECSSDTACRSALSIAEPPRASPGDPYTCPPRPRTPSAESFDSFSRKKHQSRRGIDSSPAYDREAITSAMDSAERDDISLGEASDISIPAKASWPSARNVFGDGTGAVASDRT